MFNQTFVDGAGKTKKPLTIALSVVIEIAALCMLILIPSVYTQALPMAQLRNLLVAPAPPVALHVLTAKVQTKANVRRLNTTQFVAPVVIPKRVNTINEPPPAPDAGVVGSTGNTNTGNGVISSVIGDVPGVDAPPPVSVQPKPPSGRIRVTRLSEADLIRKVQPVYPPMARSARIQGVVEFTAVISKEGNIEHLQLVRGHPLLVNAAQEAVLQWKYRPTLLNGMPVEVITDIIVNFRLNQ